MSYLGPSLRRTARRAQRAWRRAVVAVLLSLAVNALVLEQMNAHWRLAPVAPAPQRDVVLAPLSAKEWEANRAVGRAQQPQRRPESPPEVAQATPPPEPKVPRQTPGQVVDVAPSKNDAPPKDTRFVSERNNTVEKETRSRDAKAGYENTLAKPSSPNAAPGKPPPPAPPAQASAPPTPPPKPGGQAAGKGGRSGPVSPAPPPPSEAARERLALLDRGELRNPLRTPLAPVVPPRVGDGATEDGDGRPKSAGADEKGTSGSPGAPIGRIDLRPSAATLEKLAGGPAPDRLDGVEEGDGTFLNTREWKYAGYFNRIKQAVASVWDPSTAMVSRDPSGARFAHRDWDTLVMVRLDSAGVLKKVTVARASGLEFLDRLAIEAFEKAQPFANPPPGLADDHGEIAFSFGFYVQMTGSGMRVFRQQR